MEINISDYLVKGFDAGKNKRYQEAEIYADAIIEADPECGQAWALKGIAVGWQSSTTDLDNLKKATQAWKKAFSYLSDSEDIELMGGLISREYMLMMHNMFFGYMYNAVNRIGHGDAHEVLQLIEGLNKIYLLERINLGTLYSQKLGGNEENKEDVPESNPFVDLPWFPSYEWKDMLMKIKDKGEEALGKDRVSGASRPSTATFDSVMCAYIMQTLIPKILGLEYRADAYDAAEEVSNRFESLMAVQYGRSLASNLFATFKTDSRKGRSALNEELAKEEQKKKEKEEKEKQERVKTYWANHPEEKKELEDEKKFLLEQIDSCNEQIKQIESDSFPERDRLAKEKKAPTPAEEEIKKKEELRLNLIIQRDKCGIFKGKQKKELTRQIDEIKQVIIGLRETAKQERTNKENEIDNKIKELLQKQDPIKETIQEHKSRIEWIDSELTKDRPVEENI